MVALCLHLRFEAGLDRMISVSFSPVFGLLQDGKTSFFHSTTQVLEFSGTQLSQRAEEAQRYEGAVSAAPARLKTHRILRLTVLSNQLKSGVFAQAKYVCDHPEARHVASVTAVCAGWSAGLFKAFERTDAYNRSTMPCY